MHNATTLLDSESPARVAWPTAADEDRRALRYPISRWYLRPAAAWFATRLTHTPVRPSHLTACNFLAVAAAVAILAIRSDLAIFAAGLVLVAWFFDRADGLLARCQATATPWGAWLDANVDELTDVALQAAIAWLAASQTRSEVPWLLLIAFLAGKYLLMYSLNTEEAFSSTTSPHKAATVGRAPSRTPGRAVGVEGSESVCDAEPATTGRGFMDGPTGPLRWVAAAWHLPGNADVRVHLTAAAIASGFLVTELALIAAYYNLRWIVRYALVARRLGGVR